MLRSAQPSQFSKYPSQYIDTPVLAVLLSARYKVEVKYLQIRFIDFYLDLIDIYLDQTSYLDCTK